MGRVTNASIVGQQAAVLKLRIPADTHMALVKKIADCASTAVRNKLDVREGSQGNIHPPVYSFRHSSPRCFSSLLLSAPFPDIHVVACVDPYLPYFDAGAGAAVLGAGAEVLGAGADAAGAGVVFTADAAGAGVAGAGAAE